MSFLFQLGRILLIRKTPLVDGNDTVDRVVRWIQPVFIPLYTCVRIEADFVTVYIAASWTLCTLSASHTIGVNIERYHGMRNVSETLQIIDQTPETEYSHFSRAKSGSSMN